MNYSRVLPQVTALAAAVTLYGTSLPTSAQSNEPQPTVNAIVIPGAKVNIVPPRGPAVSVFPSIQQAVTWVEQNKSDTEVGQVTVKHGTYKEQVVVSKPKMWIKGACRATPCESATINSYDEQSGNTRLERYTPFPVIRSAVARAGSSLTRSATLYVRPTATDFFMTNMEVVNDFRPLASLLVWPVDQAAVAAAFQGDRSVIRNSRFRGRQDTLLLDRAGCNPGSAATDFFPSSCFIARHYVADSYIEGTVDFIFGAGAAVLNRVRVMVLPRSPKDRADRDHIITAQRGDFPLNPDGTSTQPNGFYHGFVIINSFINGRRDIGLDDQRTRIFLGRPWPINNQSKDSNGVPIPGVIPKDRAFTKVVLIDNLIARGRILDSTAGMPLRPNAPWVEWAIEKRNSQGVVTEKGTNFLPAATLLASNNRDTNGPVIRIPGTRSMTSEEVRRHQPAVFLRGGGAIPLWDLNAAPR